MLSIVQFPSNAIANISSTSGELLGDLLSVNSPLTFLIGVLIGLIVIEVIIRAIRNN